MTPKSLRKFDTATLEAIVEHAERGIKSQEVRDRFLAWTPMPHQQEWLRSDAQIRVVTVGNRGGKSDVGAISTIGECSDAWPTWFGKRAHLSWPELTLSGKRILATGESFEHLEKVICDKLKKYLPRDMLAKAPLKSYGVETHYEFKSGAVLDLMSYDQDTRLYEGSSYHFWWADEPPPKPIWDAVFRGLMENEGRVMLTATPVKEGHDWIWDELVTPAYDEDSPLHGAVAHFVGESHLNCVECTGGKGVIPHAQLLMFEAMLDEKTRESRLKGTPVGRTQRTFDYVTEEDHVVPDFDLPPGWPLIEVFDPSQARGMWCGYFTLDPNDYRYMIHRAHIPDGAPSWIAQQIWKNRGRFARAPDKSIMDQRGGQAYVNKESRQRWFDILREVGINCEPSVDDEVTLIHTLHEFLKVTEVPWQEDGKPKRMPPRLRFCESVKRIPKGPWWALQRFQWDPEQPTAKQRKQPGKDDIDLMGYFVRHPGISWKRLTAVRSDPFGDAVGKRIASTYATRSRRNQGPLYMSQGQSRSRRSQWQDRIGTGYSRG